MGARRGDANGNGHENYSKRRDMTARFIETCDFRARPRLVRRSRDSNPRWLKRSLKRRSSTSCGRASHARVEPPEATDMSDRIIESSERSQLQADQRWPAMLLDLLKRGLRHVRQYRQYRRDLPLLHQLDDHMLADIGLHRSDLAYIARHGTPPRLTAIDGR